jgi:hypothetical protein
MKAIDCIECIECFEAMDYIECVECFEAMVYIECIDRLDASTERTDFNACHACHLLQQCLFFVITMCKGEWWYDATLVVQPKNVCVMQCMVTVPHPGACPSKYSSRNRRIDGVCKVDNSNQRRAKKHTEKEGAAGPGWLSVDWFRKGRSNCLTLSRRLRLEWRTGSSSTGAGQTPLQR